MFVVIDDLKTVRAGIGNALVWGGAWVVASLVLLTILVIVGIVPSFPPLGGLLQIVASFGLTGMVVGAFFSGLLRIAYRDRDLLSINSVLFILGGAAVAGVISPFVGGMHIIGIPLGAVTAGVTLAMAKSAERQRLAELSGDAMIEGEAI